MREIRAAIGEGEFAFLRRLDLRSRELRGAQILIDFMHHWWRLGRGRLPSVGQYEVADLVDFPQLVGRFHIVDVARENLINANIELFGTKTSVIGGRVTNWSGASMGDTPDTAYRRMILSEYEGIRDRGIPDLASIVAFQNNLRIDYRRLVLPLSDDGRQVNKLLVAFVSEVGEIGRELSNDRGALDMEKVNAGLRLRTGVETFENRPSFRVTVDFGRKAGLLQPVQDQTGVPVDIPLLDGQRPADPRHQPR